MNNLNAYERRKEISKLVNESGFFKSSELHGLFNVSMMTIRRDIKWLESAGLVQAVFGGAKATDFRTGDSSFDRRIKENQQEKQAVACHALDFVKPNTIIALDAGTTILELSKLLPFNSRLTIVTHSLPVINQLSSRDDITLISLGGELSVSTQSFVGPISMLAVNELRISTLFLAIKAIQDGVLYSGNPFDAEIKRGLIEISDKIVLLVDSSKFLATAGIRVANLNEVDAIIVDNQLEMNHFSIPENVELIIAPIEEHSKQLNCERIINSDPNGRISGFNIKT